MSIINPRRYISWSSDQVDLSDPFQKRWYLQQVLTHGRMEDVRTLKLEDIAAVLGEIVLPEDVRSLWELYLETRHAQG